MYANKNGENGKQAAEAAASHDLCVWNWVRETAEEEKKRVTKAFKSSKLHKRHLSLFDDSWKSVFMYQNLLSSGSNFAMNFFFLFWV